ncbi:MAG TPA: DoxX family protein [Candidatus Binatia bacterium]|nr:DoxX family protein [Candidatus Binatia bacterium]
MESDSGFLKRSYARFTWCLDLLQSPFLLAVRVFWGWQLAVSGWGKLHHLGMVVDYFTSLNLPAPPLFARAVSTLELVGGALLLLGLFSRPISLILTGNMIGAYITADTDAWHSFFAEDAGPFFAATPFPFLMVSLLVLVFGPGKFCVDELLARFLAKRAAARA